jgi:hypothetical protein
MNQWEKETPTKSTTHKGALGEQVGQGPQRVCDS